MGSQCSSLIADDASEASAVAPQDAPSKAFITEDADDKLEVRETTRRVGTEQYPSRQPPEADGANPMVVRDAMGGRVVAAGSPKRPSSSPPFSSSPPLEGSRSGSSRRIPEQQQQQQQQQRLHPKKSQRTKTMRKQQAKPVAGSFKSIQIPKALNQPLRPQPQQPLSSLRSLSSLPDGTLTPFCSIGLPEIFRLPDIGAAAPLPQQVTPSNRSGRVCFTHQRTSVASHHGDHQHHRHQRCTSSNWSLTSELSPVGSGSTRSCLALPQRRPSSRTASLRSPSAARAERSRQTPLAAGADLGPADDSETEAAERDVEGVSPATSHFTVPDLSSQEERQLYRNPLS